MGIEDEYLMIIIILTAAALRLAGLEGGRVEAL